MREGPRIQAAELVCIRVGSAIPNREGGQGGKSRAMGYTQGLLSVPFSDIWAGFQPPHEGLLRSRTALTYSLPLNVHGVGARAVT